MHINDRNSKGQKSYRLYREELKEMYNRIHSILCFLESLLPTSTSTRYALFRNVKSVWWQFLTKVSGQSIGPKTSVRNYQLTLRNIPEERISNLFRGGNLKSRKLRVFT
jgi:hypothetical protein